MSPTPKDKDGSPRDHTPGRQVPKKRNPGARCRSQMRAGCARCFRPRRAQAQSTLSPLRSVALRGAGGLGMLQLAVGRGASAPARLLSGSTMPKKAGATSKASGKSRGVQRVGHGATPAGTRSSACRVGDLPTPCHSGPGLSLLTAH